MVSNKPILWLYTAIRYLRRLGLNRIGFLRSGKQVVIRLFTEKSDTVALTVHGQRMHFWSREQSRVEKLLYNAFEPYTTSLVKDVIRLGDTIIDIGAHVGYYTILAAKLVGDEGRVIAFEPEPENFRLLSENVRANQHRNVVLVNKAVSDRNGVSTFNLNKDSSGGHSLFMNEDSTAQIQIQCTSINLWAAQNHINQVALIKLDVEGAELVALEGMRTTIENSEKLNLFLEVNPDALQAAGNTIQSLLDLLNELGFHGIAYIDEQNRQLVQIESALSLSNLLSSTGGNLYCTR